jgi:hypothetical protein
MALVLLAVVLDSGLPLPMAASFMSENLFFSVCEGGLLEFLLVFLVVFSKKQRSVN